MSNILKLDSYEINTENIIEVFLYYDRPLNFTLKTTDGNILFHLHWFDFNDDDTGEMYLVYKTAQDEIDDLKNNKLPILDSLKKDELWVVETNYKTGELNCILKTNFNEFIERYPGSLPKDNVFMCAE